MPERCGAQTAREAGVRKSTPGVFRILAEVPPAMLVSDDHVPGVEDLRCGDGSLRSQAERSTIELGGN